MSGHDDPRKLKLDARKKGVAARPNETRLAVKERLIRGRWGGGEEGGGKEYLLSESRPHSAIAAPTRIPCAVCCDGTREGRTAKPVDNQARGFGWGPEGVEEIVMQNNEAGGWEWREGKGERETVEGGRGGKGECAVWWARAKAVVLVGCERWLPRGVYVRVPVCPCDSRVFDDLFPSLWWNCSSLFAPDS